MALSINKVTYDPEDKTFYFSIYNYHFTIDPDEDGMFLKVNSRFRLKIVGTEEYLRSVPNSKSGVSKIVVEKFDPKYQEQFYFHFGRPHTPMYFRTDPDVNISKLIRKWSLEKEKLKDFENFEDLSTFYKELKENISDIIHNHCGKEPNSQKKGKESLMCINGWVDIQKLSL